MQHQLDRLANAAAFSARVQFRLMAEAFKKRAESPIEHLMICAIWQTLNNDCTGHNLGDGFEVNFLDCDYTWPENKFDRDGIFVFQQAKVGTYRVDILIQIIDRVGVLKNLGPSCPMKFIIIECDGFDYHERTKEQAIRDKSRDRWMVGEGIAVLRFTGSEIWKNAIECSLEVEQQLCVMEGIPDERAA